LAILTRVTNAVLRVAATLGIARTAVRVML